MLKQYSHNASFSCRHAKKSYPVQFERHDNGLELEQVVHALRTSCRDG